MESNKLNLRTDLAYDEKDNIENKLYETVEIINGIEIYKHVIREEESKRFNKKCGNYYSIDLKDINFNDTKTAVCVEKALANVLKTILEEKKLINKKGLIVGLGNINVTPDALGPYVIDNIIVTRHLFNLDRISEGFSNVCALSPGVMGTTGLETYDIIASIVKNIDCDFIIAIDALATSSISRVSKVIQITDSGINPGSGVKNKRKELSFETLGIPVIALGVPTVVDSVTITHDSIEYMLNHLKDINEEKFLGDFGYLDEDNKRMLIEGILDTAGINMMVTPKEIDSDIEELTKIIANGIDLALHPGLYNGLSE
mgnify:CR=1 FL=1